MIKDESSGDTSYCAQFVLNQHRNVVSYHRNVVVSYQYLFSSLPLQHMEQQQQQQQQQHKQQQQQQGQTTKVVYIFCQYHFPHSSFYTLNIPFISFHLSHSLSFTLSHTQLRRRTALPSELVAGRDRPRSEPQIQLTREIVIVEGT